MAVKASAPELRHKAASARVALDLAAEPARPRRVPRARRRGAVLVERMAPPGAELIVAVRRDAVVPALVVGLGGVHAEVLDDVAIVPLPATPSASSAHRAAARRALLRRADLAAAARLAARARRAAGLELIECNPVLVHNEGAVVVDAVAKEISA